MKKAKLSPYAKEIMMNTAIEDLLAAMDKFISRTKFYDLEYDIGDKDAIVQAIKDVTNETFKRG